MDRQLYFEDFKTGQRFSFGRRTVTDAHFALFAAISGDNHPIHYDDVYAKRSRFGRRVAHGLLIMGMTALGAGSLSACLNESMVAFVEQSCRFLKPVFAGDSIAVEAEVADLTDKGDLGVLRFDIRMTNQEGTVVLEGSQSYLLRRRGKEQQDQQGGE
jgi:3-hydroxybutyryl-CoA dehydratase